MDPGDPGRPGHFLGPRFAVPIHPGIPANQPVRNPEDLRREAQLIEARLAARQRQQLQAAIAPPEQHLAHENLPVAGENLLPRMPSEDGKYTDALLTEVLSVFPDVNQKWIKDRAGYGAERLVHFILENHDDVPLEPGTKKRRILDVSAISDDSFFAAPHNVDDGVENELREAKIDALITYIKQSDKPRITFPREFSDYIKVKYPVVRTDVIPALKKLKNFYEVCAVCEIISLKGFTDAVSRDLHMEFLIKKGVVPWLLSDVYIKKRTKATPIADHPAAVDAVQEVRNLLKDIAPERITCAVCYDDYVIKKIISCTDSDENNEVHHLCHECLRGHAKSLCTDGSLAEGGQGLRCVSPGCENILPWAVVKKLLDKESRKILGKRIDNEAIIGLDGLESCKYCSFQMLIEASVDEMKVFACAKCKAEFCRVCKADWTDHMGRKCEEMKTVIDAKEEARKKLEEDLADAIIRQCHRCKVKFAKEEGCNKMTCRCGATQCYMCRAKDIDYKHFCPHVRDPSFPGLCPVNCPNRCLLWVKTDEINKAAIDRVKNQALTNRALHEIMENL